jgi:hypothetical protein
LEEPSSHSLEVSAPTCPSSCTELNLHPSFRVFFQLIILELLLKYSLKVLF